MMPPADFTWLYLGVLAKAQLEINGGEETHTHTHTEGYVAGVKLSEPIVSSDSPDQDAIRLNYTVLARLLRNPAICVND